MTTAPLVWMRFGAWSAHLYEAGHQLCPTQHGRLRAGGGGVPAIGVATVGPHGIPFGRVCERCLKVWHRRQKSQAARC